MLWGYVDRNQLVPSEDRSVVVVDKFLALKVLGIKTGETPRVKKGELAQQYVQLPLLVSESERRVRGRMRMGMRVRVNDW